MFNQSFVDEIVALALQIAKLQRNEDHLQSLPVLHEKYMHELEELGDAQERWDEIPDVVYYATCAAAQGFMQYYRELPAFVEMQGVSVAQAKAATLAKYRRRAAGMPKDVPAERVAILEAIKTIG